MQVSTVQSFWTRWANPYTISGLTRAGVHATTLLTMMVAVATLETTTFGAFSVAWISAVVGNTVLYSGLYEYLLRTRDVDSEKDSVFWLLFAQGAVLTGLMLAAGVLVAAFGDRSVGICLQVLSFVPLSTAVVAWCDSLLTRDGRVAGVGIVFLAAEVVGAVVLLIGIWAGGRVSALLGWRVASTLTSMIGMVLLKGSLPKLYWSSKVARTALTNALPLQGSTLVRTMSTYAGDYLLAWYLSPAASGAYRAASRVAVTGTDVFLQPLRPMTWSTLAAHERQGDTRGMRKVFLEHLRMLTFFAWPVLVCVAVFSARIFGAVAKADWSMAAPVLFVLALARMPAMVDFFLDPVLVCTGRSGLQFRVRTAFTAVMFVGIAATAKYGPVAVAQWQLACNTCLALFSAVLVCRALHVAWHEVAGSIAPGLVAAGLCATVGEVTFRAMTFPRIAGLLTSVLAMGVCLLACFWLLHKRGVIRLPQKPVAVGA